MKLGLFTDPHYSTFDDPGSARRRSLALERISAAYDSFARSGCDLVVCLGDLTDHDKSAEKERENLARISSLMDSYGVPTICLMGNHDAFDFTSDKFYAIIGENKRPRDLTENGIKLIFLDACYFSDGRRYAPGDSDWTDTFLPSADELPAKLEGCARSYIFMHQNVDPELPLNHCLSNAAELRGIFAGNGRVAAVFQGHYHPGHRSSHGGTDYITLPALCEHENAWMTVEI